MDQWDVKDRREMQANLGWVSDRRTAEKERASRAPTRRYLTMTLIGFAVTLIAAFGSFVGGELANASKTPQTIVVKLPSGQNVTITPSPGVP